jgi:hypothetical protein
MLNRNDPRDGDAVTSDGDRFTVFDVAQQFTKMGLRFVRANGLYDRSPN